MIVGAVPGGLRDGMNRYRVASGIVPTQLKKPGCTLALPLIVTRRECGPGRNRPATHAGSPLSAARYQPTWNNCSGRAPRCRARSKRFAFKELPAGARLEVSDALHPGVLAHTGELIHLHAGYDHQRGDQRLVNTVIRAPLHAGSAQLSPHSFLQQLRQPSTPLRPDIGAAVSCCPFEACSRR